MAKKKELFKRKTNGCTSIHFILCGEHFKIVEAKKLQIENETKESCSWKAAINLIILGK